MRALERARRGCRVRDERDAGHDRLAHGGRDDGRVGADVLREVFGEYRAPTGVARRGRSSQRRHARPWSRSVRSDAAAGRRGSSSPSRASTGTRTAPSRSPSPRATRAWRSCTQGIRLTPEQIAASARDEDVDVVGLSILSGSHLELVPQVIALLRAEGVEAPVVVGGIIPEEDRRRLLDAGVAAVYTPKDFELARIIDDIAHLVERRRAASR